jgi:hypothetical protein
MEYDKTGRQASTNGPSRVITLGGAAFHLTITTATTVGLKGKYLIVFLSFSMIMMRSRKRVPGEELSQKRQTDWYVCSIELLLSGGSGHS